MRLLLAMALLMAFPTLASAHPGAGDAANYLAGLQHPFKGVDHLLAMLAVGLFAHVVGGRAIWLVPASFVGMIIVGFLLGVASINFPFVEIAIALSSIVVGGCVALGRPAPSAVATGVVAAFALFHGVAHGTEMPIAASAAGFVTATAILHLLGIAAAFAAAKLTRRYGRLVVQLAGAACALGGVGALAGWI